MQDLSLPPLRPFPSPGGWWGGGAPIGSQGQQGEVLFDGPQVAPRRGQGGAVGTQGHELVPAVGLHVAHGPHAPLSLPLAPLLRPGPSGPCPGPGPAASGPLPPTYCDVDDQLSLLEAGQWSGHAHGGLRVVPSNPHVDRLGADVPLPAGTIFRLIFLGSVEVEEEGNGRKRRRRLKKTMVEEAVTKIKVCGLSVHNPVRPREWLCFRSPFFIFVFHLGLFYFNCIAATSHLTF